MNYKVKIMQKIFEKYKFNSSLILWLDKICKVAKDVFKNIHFYCY